ncbi:MAG: iron chelate uptake ABC transporter family permease subunit, partial [Longicatena caecimuris]|uniref:iron chelate uptake ABC transporter family permease subunit n=2 Tax=Erysipelotrichaceae TaxID=128827 RepID=UPI00399ADE80
MKRYFSCGLLLLILLVIALLAGRYGTNLQDMLAALCFHGDAGIQAIVWNIRIPRILLVLAGGGALAVSGLIYQTIFKNPLASGDVIGASSGCSLGAALAIVLFHDEPWITMLLAFGCGLL